jgi:hypothetical protein
VGLFFSISSNDYKNAVNHIVFISFIAALMCPQKNRIKLLSKTDRHKFLFAGIESWERSYYKQDNRTYGEPFPNRIGWLYVVDQGKCYDLPAAVNIP